MSKAQKSAQAAGFILPTVLSFIVAGLIFAGAVTQVIFTNFSLVGNNVQSQQAFNIAEAGVNYYLWHLSHNGLDYKDGGTTPTTPDAILGYGPYAHTYIDDNAVNQGTYTLWINPHGNGSTLVDVRSIGQVKNTNIKRTVQATIGATSFGNYAVVSDGALWFGSTETADGPVHSNVGVRMDGSSNDEISSTNSTYVPTDQLGGDSGTHNGVWCNAAVTSPVNCNTRDKSNWVYPTTSIDFNQVSSSLCTLKKVAFASVASTASLATGGTPCSQTPASRTAAYIPQRSSSYTSLKGYLVQLNTNGTYDLYTVNNETDTAANYSAALNLQSVATGITIPSAGVIFVEDNVWVRSNPTYHGRVTVAAGRLATASSANITIVDNLAYTTKNGEDAIGLVAENTIEIAPYAAPATGNFTLEVDAAMIAQTGNVQYPSSYNSASTCTRGWIGANQLLNFYGSVATRQTWTWSWQRSSSCGDSVYDAASGYYISGFKNNTTHFDYNLQYAPPPSYPVTGGYNIITWREVLTKP
jgi:hypothetical protein